VKLKFKKLQRDAKLPAYSKEGDGALDLVATTHSRKFSEDNNCYYLYDELGFGISVEIPEGHVGLLFPRSSISDKVQYLTNAVGVVDSNYRGEIKARFKYDTNELRRSIKSDEHGNLRYSEAYIAPRYDAGDKALQLIVIPIPKLEPEFVEELSETNRGSQGFGSSGQ